MGITRRQFLKWSGISAMGAVIFNGCTTPEQELQVESPVNLPEDLVSGIDNWYATICRQDLEACGVIVRVVEGRAKKIEGNPDYPINRGKHGVRTEAGVQSLYHPDRLSNPMFRDSRTSDFRAISWNEAHNLITNRLGSVKTAGDVNGFLVITQPLRGSLALLVTEFADGVGGKHMAFEALEKISLRKTMKEVFGQDRIPNFDIENSSYLMSFGSDFLSTWVSPTKYSRDYGEFRQGHSYRGLHVQVDSRFSMTAANADEWVAVKPGSEGILAMSMMYVIMKDGLADPRAVEILTGGIGYQALQIFSNTNQDVVNATGIDSSRIEHLAQDFANSQSPLAIGGGSASAHAGGTFNLKAIYSLNLLVNNINKEGGVIFNPPPPLQTLRTEMVTRAGSPSPYKDWSDLPTHKVVVIRGVNPVYGMSSNSGFVGALQNSEFIVSYSSFMDETAAMADLVMPEHNYLEDWGDDVPDPGPGYQILGIQQPVVRPFYSGTVSFADELLTYSRTLGLGLDEKLGLSPGTGYKDFLQKGFEELWNEGRGSVRSSDFDAFWRGVLQRGGWWDTTASYENGAESLESSSPLDIAWPDLRFDGSGDLHLIPFMSNSLGDGSLAHLPWLQATPDPMTSVVWQTWVEINTKEAHARGISQGDLIEVESSHGKVEVPAYVHPGVPPWIVSMPIGQGHTSFDRYAEGVGANTFSLLSPTILNKDTNGLAWAATKVKITNTGKHIDIPKFEGNVPAFEVEEQRIIKLAPPRFGNGHGSNH